MAKPQSKQAQNVEVKFQDETANFNLSSFAPKADPKVVLPTLAFVNLTGSSGPTQDAGKRKLVRKHVMREFQREKHEREHLVFEKWKEQNEINPKNIVPSIQQIFDPFAFESDQGPGLGGGEMEAEDGHNNLEWDVTLPYLPDGEDSVFSQRLGEWTSGFVLPIEDELVPMENMLYQPSNANSGFNPALATDLDLPFTLFDPFLTEDEDASEDKISELVECPLISNSIKGMTRDSASFSSIDPFDSVPGLRNARAQAIIYHYNKVLVATLISVVDPESKWFNYAITDPALFHGTMLHSAAHNAMLSGNTDLADPMPIKWEAAKLINQRLGDPVLSISDVTMGAVVCLVLFENQAGNVELSNIHMNGLRKMINLRGGIQNLGLAGVLKRKILWADTCHAMLTHSRPRFNLLSEPMISHAYISGLPFSSLTTPGLEFVSNSSCTCSKRLQEITNSLRQVSRTIATHFQPKHFISDSIYITEREVVSLLAPRAFSHRCSYSPINEPCLLAAFIFIYVFLRDFPLSSPLFQSITERLAASLFESDTTINMWEEDMYPMLLWVLVIGVIVSEGRCERDRFVKELGGVCAVLGVSILAEFEDVLKRIAWLDVQSATRSSRLLSIIWDNVQVVQGGEMVDVVEDGTMDVMAGF